MNLNIAALRLFLTCLTTAAPAYAQATHQIPAFKLWKFDEQHHMCRAAGRLQDRRYCQSKVMDEIVRQGKNAIPILISQLTDPRHTSQPIFDFWSRTTVGDVAYFILMDLFTESDETTFNLPGLSWPDLACTTGAETCWRTYVQKRGRKTIQREWRDAWNASKDRMVWNEDARCFRLHHKRAEEGRPSAHLAPFS